MSFKCFYVFIGFLINSLNLVAQSDTTIIQRPPGLSLNHMVNTLSACECFIRSIRSPLSPEEQRMITAYGAMRNLDFRTLDSLYTSGNDIIKLYAFGLICSNFPDSLTDEHMQLLRNKNKIRIYQKPPVEDFPKERVSDIAFELYSAIEKNRLEEIQKNQVENVIKTFISNYALYPESYIPISFTAYHQYTVHNSETLEKQENSEVHSVLHSYKLKTIGGDLVSVTHCFKLNADFVIMIIEREESTTVSCWPLKLDSWLNEFGKALTEADKEALQLNAVYQETPLTKRQLKKMLK